MVGLTKMDLKNDARKCLAANYSGAPEAMALVASEFSFTNGGTFPERLHRGMAGMASFVNGVLNKLHVWFISLLYIQNKYIIRQVDSARVCGER